MAIADADEATRVAAVASAEAKKQRDEKNQQKIEMFAFTSRDVMNITPDKDEFKIVKAWHDLGIEINKSDLLSQKVNINSLRDTSVCTTNLKKPMLQNRMYSRCNKEDYKRVDMKALLAEEALLAEVS